MFRSICGVEEGFKQNTEATVTDRSQTSTSLGDAAQEKAAEVVSRSLSSSANNLIKPVAHRPLQQNAGVINQEPTIIPNPTLECGAPNSEVIDQRKQQLVAAIVARLRVMQQVASSSTSGIHSQQTNAYAKYAEPIDPYGALRAHQQSANFEAHMSMRYPKDPMTQQIDESKVSKTTTSSRKQKRSESADVTSNPKIKKSLHKKDAAEKEVVERSAEEVLQFVNANKDKIIQFINDTISDKTIQSPLKLKVRCPTKQLLVFCMQDKERYEAAVQASALIVEQFPELKGFFE